jgi:type II secretory pathway predicted ATPase ExeA
VYTAYYGLRDKPFELVPDPRYLYPTRMHKEALAALTYGIRAQKGFLLLSGQPGSGKTTILRHLLRVLPSQVRTAFIFNTELTYEELLRAILRELNLPYEAASREEMVLTLNEYLLTEYRDGRSVLLIIDEAQNLSSAVLENIRMLSNLETDRGKPLQILLVGQPNLWRKVNQPQLQQLGQRVTVVNHLGRLTRRETAEYVSHRLRVAGSQGRQLFTRAALRQVYRQSMGNPRLINVICDESLLYSFLKKKPRVTRKMVRLGVRLRQAPRQASGRVHGRIRTARPSMRRRYAWSALGVLLMAITLLLVFTFSRKAELGGFASGALEPVGQQSASGARPAGGAQGEATARSNDGEATTDPKATPVSADTTLEPIIRRLLEGTPKQVPPSEVARQPTQAEPPAFQAPQEATIPPSRENPSHQGNALYEVRPGETLAAIAMAQYGRSDPMILNLLKRYNPTLADINQITPGWRLEIPSLGASTWVRRLDDGGFGALVLTTPSVWEANRAVSSLSQERRRARAEAVRVAQGTEWFEVLVIGLSSADEAARVGAMYQQRWGLRHK